MRMNPPTTAIMTASRSPAPASFPDAPWLPSEPESYTEAEVNHSAPVEAFDSTSGVCNELARIALNRSAVMEVYDSMFPKSGVAGVDRATSRRRAPFPTTPRIGWVQRMLDAMRGRAH